MTWRSWPCAGILTAHRLVIGYNAKRKRYNMRRTRSPRPFHDARKDCLMRSGLFVMAAVLVFLFVHAGGGEDAVGDAIFPGQLEVAHAQQAPNQRPFITTWQTYADNQTITIPLKGDDIIIFWGDGTYDNTELGVHRYTVPGTYTVSIYGDLKAMSLYDSPDASKLMSIEQWGDASWTSMADAFRGASNMVYRATDTPNLNHVANMSGMFRGASSFNGDLST